MGIERWLGIETASPVSLARLQTGNGDSVGYKPSGCLDFTRALPRREVSGEDVLLDLGCGKGRVLV